jgi:hypothetical protein
MLKKKILNGFLMLAMPFFVVLVFMVSLAQAETPYAIAWSRQLGTSGYDSGNSVAVDASGNAFITGLTYGALGGTYQGAGDAFLSKYNSSGTLVWTKQLGTTTAEESRSVAVDADGNVFISGYTAGSLCGTNQGGQDAFLCKYNTSGTQLWSQQLGMTSTDQSNSVAVDVAGNAYICGYTYNSLGGTNQGASDVFLSKYTTLGANVWTRQVGTSTYDFGKSVAVDIFGSAYFCGTTEGDMGGSNQGGSDAFLCRSNSTSGGPIWRKQLGTAQADYCNAVAVDAFGYAYISGCTYGTLGGTSSGNGDAFLSKYAPSGTLLWTQQLGSSSFDDSGSVAVDGDGNVFICGWTYGSLDGTNQGGYDLFVSKYDDDGTLLWTKQLGTSGTDYGWSLTVDGDGNVFVTGSTYGSLDGTNQGDADAFLIKLSPVPEPCSLAMLAGIAVMALLYRRRHV